MMHLPTFVGHSVPKDSLNSSLVFFGKTLRDKAWIVGLSNLCGSVAIVIVVADGCCILVDVRAFTMPSKILYLTVMLKALRSYQSLSTPCPTTENVFVTGQCTRLDIR